VFFADITAAGRLCWQIWRSRLRAGSAQEGNVVRKIDMDFSADSRPGSPRFSAMDILRQGAV